tara:strand:+ start:669 stop:1547 length:879 start_codon:yes stop_codon:yes gene_type:complete
MMSIANNIAVFIMVHGRPDKMWTYKTLRKRGYTGKIYLVGDNLDSTIKQYKKKYKDDLLVFDKKKVAQDMDAGDNTGDMRSTLYSANTIFNLAKDKGIEYFFIMCDDYRDIYYKFDDKLEYKEIPVRHKLDEVFNILLKFYKSTKAKSIAFAQNGDFIGGKKGSFGKEIKLRRKAMNTFLCSTKRPFKFVGRLNEDVNTYVNLGSKGDLFFTIPNISISQLPTQKTEGGLTDVYLEYGTYTKSFFSVMYNPSCVKVSEMGVKDKRLHHKIMWGNAVPKIINERYKKRTKANT